MFSLAQSIHDMLMSEQISMQLTTDLRSINIHEYIYNIQFYNHSQRVGSKVKTQDKDVEEPSQ